jgi:hypothetical protein
MYPQGPPDVYFSNKQEKEKIPASAATCLKVPAPMEHASNSSVETLNN